MNTRRNNLRRRIRTWLALTVVAACAIAHGDSSTTNPRDLRQKQIAEKSESERARLQHSFREFRALPEDDQRKLRLLNDELKADDRNQGGLRAVMNQYHEWLGSLTPGQREDLRKQTDPNARERRVRQLVREQQEHAESTAPPSGAKVQRGLSSDDLSAVLGVIEKALASKQMLSEEEKAQLQRKVGLARHMYVMELAFRRPGAPAGQQLWFTPPVAEAMVEAVSNPKQHKFLKSKARPEERRFVMGNLIRAGLMSEYENNQPDAATLELFFVQLPVDRQDEIMRLPHDQQQQKLTHMYLEKKSEDDPDHYPRQPRPGFWAQRPLGPRPPGMGIPGADPQRGADADQSQKEKNRKKNNKNQGKKGKAASEAPDASDNQ